MTGLEQGCILFHFYIKPQLGTIDYSISRRCILFHFYIKPQHTKKIVDTALRCILFHFYIKPQHLHSRFDLVNVVSYSISTSNHNMLDNLRESPKVVSYSISTSNHNASIKNLLGQIVVSYSISTSNHNIASQENQCVRLYLIPFLHQTTTSCWCSFVCWWLYLIPFLHQTTTKLVVLVISPGCILFHFYIKPQQVDPAILNPIVVSYSISTSNHNPQPWSTVTQPLYLIPFLHQTTTLHS